MVTRIRVMVVTAGIAAAVAATGSAQAAVPSSANCIGQSFSSHAGIVPATGGEISVGSFVSVSVRESEQPPGQEVSGVTQARGRTADFSSIRSAQGLHRPKPMQATAEREKRNDSRGPWTHPEVASTQGDAWSTRRPNGPTIGSIRCSAGSSPLE